ncbi:CHAT domain-containing protein [Streptomyces sp. NPDC005355]|uniref:CHAT domain-containing protein n=1 Tax=Streptomyces sp. NPDC005355 TaxID=3157038 RepID=UPI0033A4D5D8
MLTGPSATADAVLAALARCSWAHFARHGAYDLGRPSRNALFLHDRALPLREIVGLRLDHAEFAYLSACDTGGSSVALVNEAISVAYALNLAGTGTSSAHRRHDHDRRRRARARRGATAWHGRVGVRPAHRDPPDPGPVPHAPTSWAPYVHTGP